MKNSIIPVILSGGSGTRLWPLSTADRPKQFHALTGDDSLFETALQRLSGGPFAPPVVVCNAGHRDLVENALAKTDIEAARTFLEPVGRNTAPAVALAALDYVEHAPETLLLVAPSDHVISNPDRYLDAVETAATAAETGLMVALGIAPTRAETGYGHIRRGAAIDGLSNAFKVAAFVEKPDADTAERYVSSGDYAWNSGMFLFPAGLYIDELNRQRPDILDGCREALKQSQHFGNVIEVNEPRFTAIDGESIDYAVMEGCAKAAVVDAEFGWSDVGSWQALWEITGHDAAGNARSGETVVDDARNCLIRAEAGQKIAVLGCEDLIVVANNGTVLVAPRSRSQEIKRLADVGDTKD